MRMADITILQRISPFPISLSGPSRQRVDLFHFEKMPEISKSPGALAADTDHAENDLVARALPGQSIAAERCGATGCGGGCEKTSAGNRDVMAQFNLAHGLKRKIG
jgi:hypothetical protein